MEENDPIGAFGKDESRRCEAGLAWIPQETAEPAVVTAVTLDSALHVATGRKAQSVFVAWGGVLLVLWSGVSSLCVVGLFPPPPGASTGSTSRCGCKRRRLLGTANSVLFAACRGVEVGSSALASLHLLLGQVH